MSDRCKECNGRGWHTGDCHPQETCGVCYGIGDTTVPDLRTQLAAEKAQHAETWRLVDAFGAADSHMAADAAWRALLAKRPE